MIKLILSLVTMIVVGCGGSTSCLVICFLDHVWWGWCVQYFGRDHSSKVIVGWYRLYTKKPPPVVLVGNRCVDGVIV
jgi:hypothetical protein